MTTEPSTTPQLTTAAEAAARLDLGAVSQDGPSAGTTFMVRLVRRIAEGTPVPADEAMSLAGNLALQAARRLLDRNTERNENGDIIGAVGLSLSGHPHGFKVGGVDLQAWCAWDTFLLPQILGKEAEVTSQDPVTGTPIGLTISPERVEDSPDGVVVSVVYPDLAGSDNTGSIQELFCGFVQFFSSVETAQQWFGERDVPADVVTADEAFVLGTMRFAEMIAAGRALDET